LPVPTKMSDLSITAASNSPAGSEAPISTDDFHRAIQAILRTTNAKGSDIASAATTDIGAATAEFIDVTGTTTITGLGTIAAGIKRTVRFTGILTLTHNATSLQLPSSANITTANGDAAFFVSLGSGNWKCLSYIRQNGQPLFSGSLGYRNILINAGFRINNGNAGTPYVSGAVLASGAYGHEMWKAGASGGDYSFTQLNTNTQITIASGKSLIQVVENLNVHETDYVLSWEGTAQARAGVDSATPSGSYAASPILITGQTAGTTMSVEFNTGTLGKAQLEKGTTATPFENKDIEQIIKDTVRYFEVLGDGVDNDYGLATGQAVNVNSAIFTIRYARKRVIPTTTFNLGFSISNAAGTRATVTSVNNVAAGYHGLKATFNIAAGYTRAGDASILDLRAGSVVINARL
jgi:hypothetical protein